MGKQARIVSLVQSSGRAPETDLRHSPSMTERVLQFSWRDHLPIRLPNGESIEMITYEQSTQFIAENIERCFKERVPAFNPESDQASRREAFYKITGDFFGFFTPEGKLFGVTTGHMTDWSSYYIRFSMILPEFQGGPLAKAFMEFLDQFLEKQGVGRLSSQASPLNLSSIGVLTRQGMTFSGVEVSDRWGVILTYTKVYRRRVEHLQRFFA